VLLPLGIINLTVTVTGWALARRRWRPCSPYSSRGHVLLGRPRTQFAETAGLLVVGVGGALLYGLLPSSPAFLLA